MMKLEGGYKNKNIYMQLIRIPRNKYRGGEERWSGNPSKETDRLTSGIKQRERERERSGMIWVEKSRVGGLGEKNRGEIESNEVF
jgi:hypothetical protein